MAQAQLQQTKMTQSISDSLRFERRRADRHPVMGRVTSLFQPAQTDWQGRKRIASVQLVNISHSGVCVQTGEPVAPGTLMTLYFPPHGPERGFDAIGTVVRCIRKDDRTHELGVHFDFKPAA